MSIFYPFETREVRDLAWACFSQPLLYVGGLSPGDPIGDCRFEMTPARRAWLEGLDRDATPLRDHLAARTSHRLGIYYESLWQFFLLSDSEVDLVAHNLPVHGEGRTLGEFDCLYFCHRRQRHVHLELAVKYFLGVPESRDTSGEQDDMRWLGPDTRDRLDLKLAHLLQRQTRLSDQPAAIALLQSLDIGIPLKEVALRGQLFQPLDLPLAAPAGYNPECPFHCWVPLDRLCDFADGFDDAHFTTLAKMHWLSPAWHRVAADGADIDRLEADLLQHFSEQHYPVMVAVLDGLGQERARFFVTGEDWPKRTRRG